MARFEDRRYCCGVRLPKIGVVKRARIGRLQRAVTVARRGTIMCCLSSAAMLLLNQSFFKNSIVRFLKERHVQKMQLMFFRRLLLRWSLVTVHYRFCAYGFAGKQLDYRIQ